MNVIPDKVKSGEPNLEHGTSGNDRFRIIEHGKGQFGKSAIWKLTILKKGFVRIQRRKVNLKKQALGNDIWKKTIPGKGDQSEQYKSETIDRPYVKLRNITFGQGTWNKIIPKTKVSLTNYNPQNMETRLIYKSMRKITILQQEQSG